MDFWISDWISGFQIGFLDFWISVWISADGVRDFFRDGRPLGLTVCLINYYYAQAELFISLLVCVGNFDERILSSSS